MDEIAEIEMIETVIVPKIGDDPGQEIVPALIRNTNVAGAGTEIKEVCFKVYLLFTNLVFFMEHSKKT